MEFLVSSFEFSLLTFLKLHTVRKDVLVRLVINIQLQYTRVI